MHVSGIASCHWRDREHAANSLNRSSAWSCPHSFALYRMAVVGRISRSDSDNAHAIYDSLQILLRMLPFDQNPPDDLLKAQAQSVFFSSRFPRHLLVQWGRVSKMQSHTWKPPHQFPVPKHHESYSIAECPFLRHKFLLPLLAPLRFLIRVYEQACIREESEKSDLCNLEKLQFFASLSSKCVAVLFSFYQASLRLI